MYLKSIHSVNVGPIEDAKIIFPFNEDGTPKPVVIVGENGTGKSVLLSNIVDSFYEIAGVAFSDVREKDSFSRGDLYYKAVLPQEIKIGKQYMYSYLEYFDNVINDFHIKYVLKSGHLSTQDFFKIENIQSNNKFNWEYEDNYKNTIVDKKKVEKILSEEILCYFSPERYEKPNWMGNRYYELSNFEHLTIKEKWSGRLNKPILVTNVNVQTYADSNDINKSINLKDITGIVVIDEIELHLHSNLQRKVLPKLLKRFPKVQFIISSHSPLFLLGMDEVYGRDGYEIYQMPSAIRITSERFSEFEKAYNYLTETETYQQSIRQEIQKHQGKHLIITEGSTDWKHIKAAFQHLKLKPEYQDYEKMDFEFLEYGKDIEMGNKNLEDMCRHFSTIKQPRKMIFVADADVDKTNKALRGKNSSSYKNWGNNVFSFVLPLPEHRQTTPEICIEHYYTDDEIKTSIEIDGKPRRLYIGNEFNKDGISLDSKFFCRDRNSCGNGKINIIDGNDGKSVYAIGDQKETNLALPKMKFAEGILDQLPEFADINFNNFHLIFDIIKQILEQPDVENGSEKLC